MRGWEGEEERERGVGSFDSFDLRLQRRKSETEFPCRVYPPMDLDGQYVSEIRETPTAEFIGAFSGKFSLWFLLLRRNNEKIHFI